MERKRTIQQDHALFLCCLTSRNRLGVAKELSVEKIFCVGRSQAACIRLDHFLQTTFYDDIKSILFTIIDHHY